LRLALLALTDDSRRFSPRKRRVADRLASATARGESRQTMLCAYLALALLVGLAGNAAARALVADPAAAIVIAAVAAREGAHAWRARAVVRRSRSQRRTHAHTGH